MDGRSSGSGKYTYNARHSRNLSVHVSSTPEDRYNFRIAFTHNGEAIAPVLKLDSTEAQLLWAALNQTANDLGWKDYGEDDE